MTITAGKITLWGVEVFVATAEEGSITLAAKRLGSSAATVSQQITNLEGALGTTLLNRGARPVSLTPAGDMFLRRANTILNEAAQAQAEVALADLSRLTRFRLGMIDDFDADVTPVLLTEMGEMLMNCQFSLETAASHKLLGRLEARVLDVIVAADNGHGREMHEVHPLLEEPFFVAAPKNSVKGDDVAAQLRRLPMIQYTNDHYMGQMITEHLADHNIKLRHRYELDSYHAIMAMVASGAGWAVVTPLTWRRAGRFRHEVDILPLPFGELTRRISLIARRDVLGGFPAEIAGRLKPLLDEMIAAPTVADLPWLAGKLRML